MDLTMVNGGTEEARMKNQLRVTRMLSILVLASALLNPGAASAAEEGSQITAKPPFTPDYTILRREEGYNNIADQLDQLWHDIDNGKFGEDAKTGIWYNGIKSTKAAYPKT